MRGAVTLAAAQTLPEDTPQRSLLVLIAFLVAAGSLIIQGRTLPRVVRLVNPARDRADPDEPARMRSTAGRGGRGHQPPRGGARGAARGRSSTPRDDGTFNADQLNRALVLLDAEQIGIELRDG